MCSEIKYAVGLRKDSKYLYLNQKYISAKTLTYNIPSLKAFEIFTTDDLLESVTYKSIHGANSLIEKASSVRNFGYELDLITLEVVTHIRDINLKYSEDYQKHIDRKWYLDNYRFDLSGKISSCENEDEKEQLRVELREVQAERKELETIIKKWGK